MALDIEEHEQIEQVKAWLKEYGASIVMSVILAAALLFGYQHWQFLNERAYAHASARYEQLLDNLAANQTAAANASAEYLIKRYPASDYAKLAELLLVKRDITQNKYEDAEKKLKDVMLRGRTPAINQVARLRLARLEMQMDQGNNALKTLEHVDDKAYLPMISSERGDAYAQLKKNNEAREAYQQALVNIPEEAILHSLVVMKLNNLSA